MKFVRKLAILGLPVLLLGAGILVWSPGTAYAATYTVTNTNDSGAGSLRQAIVDANANVGADSISFNIAGAGVHTIAPLTNLPEITDQVTIDGETQSGADCDPRTLLIELSGENLDVNDANVGIHLGSGSSNSVVKGLVINRFTSDEETPASGAGLLISSGSASNVVSCNHSGTNVAGDAMLSNNTGVALFEAGSNNQIGGITSADRNLVSGNAIGVAVFDSPDSTIRGNYIGTDVSGTSSIRNAYGVYVVGQNVPDLNLVVGGTVAGARNVLSGNFYNAIVFASGIDFLGNYIGTNASGTVRITTVDSSVNTTGLFITGEEINIGSTLDGARNVISGNAYGINTNSDSPASINVVGNYIGTNATGDACISGPQYSGIFLGQSVDSVIGGNSAAARNVISCHSDDEGWGVFFSNNGESEGNIIQGNYIGTDANGHVAAGFGNTTGGIIVSRGDNNLIGGTGAGEGNVIAGNTGAGVVVEGPVIDPDDPDAGQPLNNSIIGNSIHSNGLLGIDLALGEDDSGVTPNDSGDPDYGPNHLMNFPVINSASEDGSSVTVNYDLDINPTEPGATGYNVSFYASATADPSGYGEGEIYLGSDTVSGDVTNQSKTLTLPSGVPSSYFVTAVTTMTDDSDDGFGHSSEFSAAVAAVSSGGGSGGGGAGSDSTSTSGDLADTGENVQWLVILAVVLLVTGSVGGAVVMRKHRA